MPTTLVPLQAASLTRALVSRSSSVCRTTRVARKRLCGQRTLHRASSAARLRQKNGDDGTIVILSPQEPQDVHRSRHRLLGHNSRQRARLESMRAISCLHPLASVFTTPGCSPCEGAHMAVRAARAVRVARRIMGNLQSGRRRTRQLWPSVSSFGEPELDWLPRRGGGRCAGLRHNAPARRCLACRPCHLAPSTKRAGGVLMDAMPINFNRKVILSPPGPILPEGRPQLDP